MNLTARDVMRTDVQVIRPDETLAELDRELLEKRVGGFPVVEKERLVGIVSRSDVVRRLSIEQSLAENVSDYYRDTSGYDVDPFESLSEIGTRVGARIEDLRVRDVMSRTIISVPPDASLRELARTLLEHGIHRVPVAEGDRLVGIVTGLDLVRLIAEDRVPVD